MIKQFVICFFVCLVIISQASGCNRTCGFGSTAKQVPYPFGFSPGCPIQINCTQSGTFSIDKFPVQSFTTDNAILVRVRAKCDRPFNTLRHLFGPNFAPTSRNGILLRNCSNPTTGCLIPSTDVQTNFELLDCDSSPVKGKNISCYTEKGKSKEFTVYDDVARSKCGVLFSAISVEEGGDTAMSLRVEMVKLGWWVEGECGDLCLRGTEARCDGIVSPVTGRNAVRCRCKDGYSGDGFRAGAGCWKDSSTCNIIKYLSGKCRGKSGIGALVGGIIVALALIICVGLVLCFCRNRSDASHKMLKKLNSSEYRGISIPIHPYKEIERATNFFSEKQCLGSGAYGTVYAGKLNNEWVAVKRIKYRGSDCVTKVLNEIKLLSSVKHPNLVRLLGCSIERGEQILVYEYMPNGTLSQHLQRERSGRLSWPSRLNIAMETAQAIAYLHSTMDPPIYHRDIKSSNILLDFNYKSKVADFGLSRLGMMDPFNSHISTAPQGTPGYLDPQYHQNFHLSDKSDVYSFGVVLVEIMTAMKVVDFCRPQNEVNLASLAIDRIGKGHLVEIIDPLIDLKSDGWAISSLNKVAELAFRCLAFDRELRPSMTEVAAELERIKISIWPVNVVASSESYCSTSSSNGPWLSEENSPSSNSLLNHAVR